MSKMPESIKEKFVKRIGEIVETFKNCSPTMPVKLSDVLREIVNAYDDYKQDCEDYMRSVRTMLNLTKE